MHLVPQILADALSTYPKLFEHLATSWLETGATSFEIWSADHMFARWGDDIAPDNQTRIQATIQIQNLPAWGRLCVTGLSETVSVRTRLQGDTLFLATLLQLVDEQEHMVTDLIETQDQLLAVYNLTQSDCYRVYFLEMDQMLRCMAKQVVNLLTAEGGFLLLNSSDRFEHMACFPSDFEESLQHYLPTLLETTADKQEILINHESSRHMLPPYMNNILLVYTCVRDTTELYTGLINKEGGFSSPDLKLLRAIAEQFRGRIENFLLHQETLEQTKLQTEMHMAHQVQYRLLPQTMPTIEGLEIHADWRPARQASGDFYDVLVRPNYPLTLTLGDVSGKGMPAALLTVKILTETRSQSIILLDPQPAEILRCINNSLYEDFTQSDMMATMFIGQYEQTCHELRYSNAGHAPVVYCPAKGEARLLQADGPPLGVLPMITYHNQSLFLEQDDVVVIATDGFHESHNAEGTMFGHKQFIELVSHLRAHSAQEIAQHIFATIDQFVGRTSQEHALEDDQAIVVLKGTDHVIQTCVQRNKLLRLDIPAAPEYLDMIGSGIVAMLQRELNLDESDKTIFSVRLAVHELCANIVQHAYQQEVGHISMTITLASPPRRLIVETHDTGASCNPNGIPEPDVLDEHGRGVKLIRMLMDEVTYYDARSQVWHCEQGEVWHSISTSHPNPGHNSWYLVKHL